MINNLTQGFFTGVISNWHPGCSGWTGDHSLSGNHSWSGLRAGSAFRCKDTWGTRIINTSSQDQYIQYVDQLRKVCDILKVLACWLTDDAYQFLVVNVVGNSNSWGAGE